MLCSLFLHYMLIITTIQNTVCELFTSSSGKYVYPNINYQFLCLCHKCLHIYICITHIHKELTFYQLAVFRPYFEQQWYKGQHAPFEMWTTRDSDRMEKCYAQGTKAKNLTLNSAFFPLWLEILVAFCFWIFPK